MVGRNGVYEWHEHRIHWMSEKAPPQVKDDEEETKVFDWVVPLDVGGERVEVSGTLFWDPHSEEAEAAEAAESGGFPAVAVGAGVAGLLAVVGAGAFFVRRRPRGPGDGPSEAW